MVHAVRNAELVFSRTPARHGGLGHEGRQAETGPLLRPQGQGPLVQGDREVARRRAVPGVRQRGQGLRRRPGEPEHDEPQPA